ncbi:helix-turn-helix domain-containing protein [Pseudomonas moorei]|uniref:helix-turn-helix domain-containing protein n=1 Tax=Pseudomonas moorei TaxID=395599 RepID=UPI00200ED1C2
MEVREAFGKALRLVRLQKGQTQEDFSIVSSRTFVSMLERAVTSPTLDKLDDLCSVLGVHPVSLLAVAYVYKDGGSSADELLASITEEVKMLLAATDLP